MSSFRSIRIFPRHGSRTATVTWLLPPSMQDGAVDVAFSLTAAPDSWELKTSTPVSAAAGEFVDDKFLIQAGVPIGYYKLHWTRGDESELSESIGIFGDVTKREYGIAHAIMLREFMVMRATDGFPVFHFITRTSGPLAKTTDPDTQEVMGEELSGTSGQSFDKTFLGGFYPPLLTWVRPTEAIRGRQGDHDDGLGASDETSMKAVMLAYPQPQRFHMLVDPVTDRRYGITNVDMHAVRANVPAAYDITMEFLQTSHPAYRVELPSTDVRDWRAIKPYFIR